MTKQQACDAVNDAFHQICLAAVNKLRQNNDSEDVVRDIIGVVDETILKINRIPDRPSKTGADAQRNGREGVMPESTTGTARPAVMTRVIGGG
jgi:hypothetical protein